MNTTRLILRQFQMSDSKMSYQNFEQDASIGKFMPMFPFSSIEDFEKMISDFLHNENIWLIVEEMTDLPIGYVTADIAYESLKTVEIGYVLGSKFQHKGYAIEAVKKIIQYLFEIKHMYLIEAKINEYNIPSKHLLEKLGFIEDGRLRSRRIDSSTGERNDLLIYSLLQNELIHN